ncbi:MAG TPA: dipeptide epimerase [Candidatus Cybelea sp.]|jgi:L-Ala-D/L-Glu epimerase / N-acetyl-D-glutamate racemase|nr:dipeptide epimerase [Candidatus Cybelea sp.]
MALFSISVSAMELPLVHPFKIARGEEAIARTAVVRVRGSDLEGIGEATPIERYGESVESVVEYFARNPLAGDDPFRLESLLHAEIPAAARAGLDLALHDLIGKELGKPLYALLGLDPSRAPLTSFTIGIADPAMTLRKVDEAAHYPILKVKLGTGTLAEQVEIVAAIRARYAGALRIDANEGWSVDEAITILRELARYEIEFCEQPITAGNPQGLRAIRDRVSIPIVADEDCLVASDLPPLYGCVDGVNVKLAKAGGVRGALAVIHTARAMGLKVMIGCMVESAIAATAAAHVSPLADWADLDGPLLISRDPFTGVRYDGGKLLLPDAPGLGVKEAAFA